MAFKVVVSNKADSYQVEVDDAKALNGLVIGDEFDGGIVGLDGYTLKITGGSDKNGFTMKKDVPGTRRIKSLLTGGTGYHPKKVKKVKGILRINAQKFLCILFLIIIIFVFYMQKLYDQKDIY